VGAQIKQDDFRVNPPMIVNVPEIEAIRAEMLIEVEQEGFAVIPCARAANLTMNRDRIRDVAVSLGVRMAKNQNALEKNEKCGGKD
jgi:phosphoribosylglycinamide formyltransferase 2